MRRFLILGLGTFGSHLARRLVENGCEVVGVDRSQDVADELRSELAQVHMFDVTDRKALESLSVREFDAVAVSLGDRMDSTILSAMYLKELGAKRVVAKAVTLDHAKILRHVGADEVVFPERDMALRLAARLAWPNVLEDLRLAPGYSILEIAPAPEIVGKSLGESRIRNRYNVHVIAVRELVPDRLVVAPGADFVVKDSDILVVLGRDENLEKIRRR
ncbi:MAG: TrkA family potassium uptake protein [Planctomycetota bacterium]|nr:TrkA family potassium uptake protein [Planctomycetota bacterium]